MSIHLHTLTIFCKIKCIYFIYLQFCEIISTPSVSECVGPIIDTLLDYVGHVKLCSRITEHLDSCKDWARIKEKSGEKFFLISSFAETKIIDMQLNSVSNKWNKNEKLKPLYFSSSLHTDASEQTQDSSANGNPQTEANQCSSSTRETTQVFEL